MKIQSLALILIILVSVQSNFLRQNNVQIPEYLAINVPDLVAKPQMHEFLQHNYYVLLNESQGIIRTDFQQIEQVFETNESTGNWRYPLSWHTTILYIGTNYLQLLNPIYVNFQPGKKIELTSQTMVYIPTKIICSPVFPKGQEIANPIPHVTIMQGQWDALYCNDVLQAVFSEGAPLEKYYNQLQDQDLEIYDKLILEIIDEIVEVFVIKTPKNYPKQEYYASFDLEGTTAYNY